MTLRDLLEKRARLVQDMRAISEKPDGQRGDLSEDQALRFDQLKGDLESTEAAIQRQQLIDDAERRMEGEPISGSGDQNLDQELRKFSLVKAIAGQAGLVVDDGLEREVSAELQRRSGQPSDGILVPMEVFQVRSEERVISTTAPVAGPGSNLVPTDHLAGQYIDLLRSKLTIKRLGARVLSGLHGNVDIPKLKVSATAGWVAENSALSASDLQFDKIQMTPKHAGALAELSRNMLQQTSPDVEQLVRADFAAILAGAVDSVAIDGGGSNEPTGILQTMGIGDVAIGTNGGPITWGSVIDLIAEVETDDAVGTAFLTNPKVVKSARQTAKVSSTDSVMVMQAPNELAGYPLAATNLVPSDLDKGTSTGVCSALIFGNFADLLLGYWSAFDLLVNPYESTAYTKGNVQVRAMLTCDVAVRHPESFAAIQDLTTA